MRTVTYVRTKKTSVSIYLVCYTIMTYLIHAHIIYELCCCLLLGIIVLTSSCNITKIDKTLILSILVTYNLCFVTFTAFNCDWILESQPNCHTWPIPFYWPSWYSVATLIHYPCTIAFTGLADWSAFLELVLPNMWSHVWDNGPMESTI